MSMSDRDGFIWQDGQLVPWREATTHVLTHSLHYGLAVFEGVRAYKTESTARPSSSSRNTPTACSTRRTSTACRCRTTRRR